MRNSDGPVPEKKLMNARPCATPELTDQDILEAMKEVSGYLDITPGDLREVYLSAYRLAAKRLWGDRKARDAMTREVRFVSPDTSLEDAARLMGRSGISGVPVLDDSKRVLGVISERDFMRHMGKGRSGSFMEIIAECIGAKSCAVLPIRGGKVSDLMTSPAHTVSEDAPLSEVADLLTKRRINRVPVTESHGLLVGILTRGDLTAISL